MKCKRRNCSRSVGKRGLCWKHYETKCKRIGCLRGRWTGMLCREHYADKCERCTLRALPGGLCWKHYAEIADVRCQRPFCANLAETMSFCPEHYAEAVAAGVKWCKRPSCSNLAGSRSTGLCKKHYNLRAPAVAPGVVADRIGLLRARGYTLRHLSKVSGVHPEALSEIAAHKTVYVYRETADKIMAVPVPSDLIQVANPRSSPRMSGVGTRRRLQGLMAAGHSQAQIGRDLGVTPQRVAQWARSENISTATAARVKELFNRLQVVPGTDKRARTHALRKGWLPALAWDEDEIDDPNAQPHMVKGLPGDWVPRLQEYRALGLSVRMMAQMEGVSTLAIYKRLERLAA